MSSYEKPNYTQIPNALFDSHLPDMKESELKVVMAIARATFGWHKDSDKLSLSQLMDRTGLTRQGVVNGLQSGISRGIITREQDGMGFVYSLVISDKVVNEVDQSTKNTSQRNRPVKRKSSQRNRPLLVNEIDQLSEKVVNEIDPQKKRDDIKESKNKHHQIKGEDDLPGKFLRTIIEDAGFVYFDRNFNEVAMRLESTYSAEQLIRATQQAKEAHQKKIGSGERGITAPLAYISSILSVNSNGQHPGVVAEPKAKKVVINNQYSGQLEEKVGK